MSFSIRGIGTAVPAHHLTQEEAAELHADLAGVSDRERRTLGAIYRRSGIEKRHSVLLESDEGPLRGRQRFYAGAELEGVDGPGTHPRMCRYEEDAPELASTAARRALEEADVREDDITHVVTVSCTGFFAPGLDTALIERLGLPRTAERTHVGFMGCHGALNAFRVARSFTAADPSAQVLICSVELCSLHFGYAWNGDAIVSRALFSDGAAAVVGTGNGVPQSASSDVWSAAANGTYLVPYSEDAMTWRIGDHGFDMSLSARVPGLIQASAGDWLKAWLSDQGLGLEDVASWAVHPGGPRVLEAFSESVGIERGETDVSRAVLAEYGNMSSATVLFILDRLRKAEAPRPCVALGFGPGLVIEALLLR